MNYKVEFRETTKQFPVNLGEVRNISDGGYERGLEEGQKQGYQTGYEQGETEGYSEGYDKGLVDGNTFYDAFWDAYQQNGERTDYEKAFTGYFCNDKSFKPKYDIIPTISAWNMFQDCRITDLVKTLDECGVKLDFSSCQTTSGAFSGTITTAGIVDLRGVTVVSNGMSTFGSAQKLRSVEKVIYPSKHYTHSMTSAYSNCKALTDIVIEGWICSTIPLKNSPLTLASAISFINALENYAGTESEYTHTILFSPTTWGYLDAEGETASPNGNSWREYINDLGWNAS